MLKQFLKFLHPRFQTLFLEYPVKFEPRYGHGKPAHQGLETIIAENDEEYKTRLLRALDLKEFIWKIQDSSIETNSILPTWNNDFLPGLDIVGIYALLTEFKPNRYIEIGSGNSTKVAHLAKVDQGLKTKIISIDPMPRAEIDVLADEVIRSPFENIDYDLIAALEENDILFVDNSHRILPNSDAMVFFMEVLPRLKKGVIVHIHDIYLPYDYPQFMCDRFYSEQYGLAMYLLANPKKYHTILPNFYVSENKELAQVIAPMWEHKNLVNVEKHGGSYWLQIAE
ncbi:MAG: class I SAM-dependent methyltransferase [Bacteroidetes bacterium]|nr:class I SAM-dependent methyltransferase [Bacteroidota bacterium]